MTAVQLISRIRERYGVDVGVGSMFEYGTIRALAEEIRALRAADAPARPEPVTAEGWR